MMNKKNLYEKIAEIIKIENHILLAIGAMAKLTLELIKAKNNESNNIIGEITDVELILDQLKFRKNCEGRVNELKKQRLKKLEKMFNKGEKNG